MMTQTVENSKIKVTIPMSEWDARVSKCRAWNGETQEQMARGRLLSDAMAKIGYRSRTKEEFAINPRDVSSYVEMVFMSEFLSENTHYAPDETISRYLSGRIMSEGMRAECTRAKAHASHRMIEDTTLVQQLKSQYIEMHQDSHDSWEKRLDACGEFGSWEIEILDRSSFPNQIGLSVIDQDQLQ